MAVDDGYKLDLFQLYAGQRVMNSLAFGRKAETPPTQAECLALATDWANHLAPLQVAQLSHTGWRVSQLSGTGVTYPQGLCRRVGGLVFEGAYTGTIVGALAGDGLPPQSAAVITLKTALAGRSRRGRFYMCGIVEGITADGTFGSGLISQWQTAWNAQLAQYSGSGTDPTWYMAVWSQTIATGCRPAAQHPHAPAFSQAPSPGTALQAVTSLTPRAIVYTQRRRTIGVGQ